MRRSGMMEAWKPKPCLERLAGFESTSAPLLSLYVDARSDQHGKDNFGPVVEKSLGEVRHAYPLRSPQRDSVEADVSRIEDHLGSALAPAANGAALFACTAAGIFEAIQLAVPVARTELVVGSMAHLVPLARAVDDHPSCAVLMADREHARLLLFELGVELASATVTVEEKVPRPVAGGWSQMRFQSHADEHRLHHVRESIAALETLIRPRDVAHLLLAGDDIVGPLLQAELPPALAALAIGVVPLDMKTPDDEVRRVAQEAVRRREFELDVERVRGIRDAHCSGGLATMGPVSVAEAIGRGQVHELVLSAALDGPEPDAAANALVLGALRTAATVRFIDDAGLLADVDGVAAWLRYRL
jgi:peptide subunit release factor 1 (eRF1)